MRKVTHPKDYLVIEQTSYYSIRMFIYLKNKYVSRCEENKITYTQLAREITASFLFVPILTK